MTTGQNPLAVWLRRRRSQLRLSISEAARRCRVRRATWADWEAARNVPRSRNYDSIEKTLEWEPGSVEAVLAGGEPLAQALGPDPYFDEVTEQTYTDLGEQVLWRARSTFAQPYIRELGPERAYELGAERAREHIRLYRDQRDMPRRVA